MATLILCRAQSRKSIETGCNFAGLSKTNCHGLPNFSKVTVRKDLLDVQLSFSAGNIGLHQGCLHTLIKIGVASDSSMCSLYNQSKLISKTKYYLGQTFKEWQDEVKTKLSLTY